MAAGEAAKRVLVADGDPVLRQSIASFVSARGYVVSECETSSHATTVLSTEAIDVLVADTGMSEGGLQLLAIARRIAPSTRSLVIGKDVTRADREVALRLGAIRVLPKPVSLLDLGDAVDLAAECAEGFHGWLHGLSLPDLLQMFHMTLASLTLRMRGGLEGKLLFRDGNIVHAECDAEVGRPALARLLSQRTGAIETGPLEMSSQTIFEPFARVVLDSLREVDETRKRPSMIAPARRASSGENSFAGLFDEVRRSSWPSPPAAVVAQDEEDLRVMLEHDRRVAIRRALAQHAPGSFAWVCEVSTGAIQRVDEWESPPDLGSAVHAFGLALALAAQVDPNWTVAELTYEGFVVALIRQDTSLLGVARVTTGEELLRRFRVELIQLRRYWRGEPDAR